ncbi:MULTISPECIES: A24 family peptidase [Comamonas]|uniref:Prepilin peptidase n=1 Tax=Comamonas terrigena TaxID=32013 RepID=A0A2A7USC1_COMTR|nr:MULTISPECIES: A24 family peptidase [Comamonas]MBP7353086.1 prepilin peptidase [Comamonas sp.]MBD9533336.1 prepilin peptidase [Comamonas sp. CMM01]PEH88168.1 prepilin peptidase [Comamonas terrigena]SUY87271.1 Flp pilus assembly protein, protease CpaA [Comamonas terrigena]BBL23102.1 pilus assembly-related outer membrane protein [Comamonas terrigena NBRC 13299]
MDFSELRAGAELVGALLTEPRSLLLLLLLLAAAICDLRSRRIPNALTFGGAAIALLYSLTSSSHHGGGFFWALGGMCLGLVLMLPLYLLRAMGAGDVKLMAMAGAFLGPDGAWHAVVFVFIAGGIAALVYALWHRAARKLLHNTRQTTQLLFISVAAGIRPDARTSSAPSVGTLPYGVSIALGTASFLVARQFTWV